MTENEAPAAPATTSQCPWCAAPTTADATRCSACGAVIAQRESIGDLRIPGLTNVDPALEDFDKRPLHLRGPSPTQGMAPALLIGAVAGGPIGIAAIGGVAAVAAAEYMGAGGGGTSPTQLEEVGRPSEVVLQALDKLGETGAQAVQPSTPADDPTVQDAATDGRDIWRDLPEQTPRLHGDEEEGTDGG